MSTTTTACPTCAAHDQDVLDPTYVPWPLAVVRQHFAPVASGSGCAPLHYYLRGARAAAQHAAAHVGDHTPACEAADHQIEKDERFWVMGALLAAFHAPDRVGTLARLLGVALGQQPPCDGGFATWRDALGEAADLELYFEANLPAPVAYKTSFADGTPLRALVPHQRSLAEAKLSRHWTSPTPGGPALEGKTWVDALLVSRTTGVAVAFEAKVLSDVSTHTTYDDTRNQIARNLDVLLERNERVCDALRARRPERSCFVLLTPRRFTARGTRLYGHLMEEYRHGPGLLEEHLPHRDPAVLEGVRRRLGRLTFEDVRDHVPGACGWF